MGDTYFVRTVSVAYISLAIRYHQCIGVFIVFNDNLSIIVNIITISQLVVNSYFDDIALFLVEPKYKEEYQRNNYDACNQKNIV